MNSALTKTYEFINRIMFGFLVIDCFGHKCQIINIPIPCSGLSIIQLIIVLRIIAINWQFWNITGLIHNRHINRFNISSSNEPQNDTTTIYRNHLYEEIQDIRLEKQIIMAWLTVLEIVIFTLANIATSGYQLQLVMLGIFINSWQEIEQN